MILGKSEIGKLPRIGRRQSITTETFTIDAYIQRQNLTDTFTMDTHLAVPGLLEEFTIDTHILTGTYTQTFTIDAILLKVIRFTMDTILRKQWTETFTVDSHISTLGTTETFTIDGHLALPTTETFTIDGLLQTTRTEPFTIDGHLALPTTETFTIDGLLQKTWTEPFTIDSHIALPTTETFTMDGLLQKTWTEPFTIDSHIATLGLTKTFTVDGHLALPTTETFTIDGLLQKTWTEPFTIDGHLATLGLTKTFTIDGLLQTTWTEPFTIDSHIATLGRTEPFTIDGHLALPTTETFTVDMAVAAFKTKQFTMDSILYKAPYYEINNIDITAHIKDPRISGLGNKIAASSSPDNVRASLKTTGMSNLSFEFDVQYYTEADHDTFYETVNSLTGPCYWYHGRGDWFYRVKSVSVKPEDVRHITRFYKSRVGLELEDPYQYSVSGDTLVLTSAALPYTSAHTFNNWGNVSTPFWDVSITGNYASSSHLKGVYFEIMNGSTTESSILISDRLLSSEVASLDVDGDLTCTYQDTYASSTKFGQDKYASSSAAVSGGNLVISSGGYATYKLYGPHPTKENVKLTAKIDATGSPYIRVSDDGSSWDTAVRTTDIARGTENEYYISGSEKLSDVYIQFYCPAGSTMKISGIEFEAVRDTRYYELPEIGVDASRTIKVRDASSSSHAAGINLTFKSRKWPS